VEGGETAGAAAEVGRRGRPSMWGMGGQQREDFPFFSLFKWRIEEDLCVVKIIIF
jgi:hypothetical protein